MRGTKTGAQARQRGPLHSQRVRSGLLHVAAAARGSSICKLGIDASTTMALPEGWQAVPTGPCLLWAGSTWVVWAHCCFFCWDKFCRWEGSGEGTTWPLPLVWLQSWPSGVTVLWHWGVCLAALFLLAVLSSGSVWRLEQSLLGCWWAGLGFGLKWTKAT